MLSRQAPKGVVMWLLKANKRSFLWFWLTRDTGALSGEPRAGTQRAMEGGV